MSTQLRKEEIFRIALTAGEMLIRNGAEVVRTEETIHRICASRGFFEASAFVSPTVIIIGNDEENGPSYVCNIKKRGNDLYRIMLINDFSRRFVKTPMSFDEAMKDLNAIVNATGYKNYVMALGGSIGSSAFSLLIGSSPKDFLPCMITAFLCMIIMFRLDQKVFSVLLHLLLGVLIAIFGNLLTMIGFGQNTDMIIIGAMLPFLPGIPFTNGVRDFMYGDLISGTSRMVESVVLIVALSFGVGLVMNILHLIQGGFL